MFKLNLLLISLIVIFSVFGLVLGDDTEFETKYGKIKGELAEGYKGKKLVILRGVPFAKPPIADLRFKKTQELDKFPADPFEVRRSLC